MPKQNKFQEQNDPQFLDLVKLTFSKSKTYRPKYMHKKI